MLKELCRKLIGNSWLLNKRVHGLWNNGINDSSIKLVNQSQMEAKTLIEKGQEILESSLNQRQRE